jgi:putative transposase
MSRFRKLSQTLWYHIIWTPKYRYRMLTGDLAQDVESCVRGFSERMSCEVTEMNVQADQVHLLAMVPSEDIHFRLPLMTMAASDRIAETDLALPIPMYVRFQARGNPIVGTTLDYFEFRGLQIAKGRQLAVLGDCVLGARVAKSLALKPGDSRMTIAKMIAAEILIIVVCSAFLCGIMMVAVQSISNDIVRMLFIR